MVASSLESVNVNTAKSLASKASSREDWGNGVVVVGAAGGEVRLMGVVVVVDGGMDGVAWRDIDRVG